ncbi:hypothetical protein PO909_026446 [Leuciscus waleckii]
MSGLVQGMSVSASVFTLFRCIVYPFQPKLTLLVAKVTIVMIWVLAVVIMCPSAVMLTVERVEHHYMVNNEDYNHTYTLFSCFENWANPQMRKVYTTVLFAHIYLIPLTLQKGRPLISQKKIKVIKMLSIVALLFTLSWLPLWTLMLLTDYGGLNEDDLEMLSGYVFPFAHWLAYYNENFKRGFQAVCSTHSCCCEGMSVKSGIQRTAGGDIRDPAVNSNPLNFGARNRVYNDGDLKNSGTSMELENRRTGRLCNNSACSNDTGSSAGSGTKGVTNQKVFQMEEPESPIRRGKNQAWDE